MELTDEEIHILRMEYRLSGINNRVVEGKEISFASFPESDYKESISIIKSLLDKHIIEKHPHSLFPLWYRLTDLGISLSILLGE